MLLVILKVKKVLKKNYKKDLQITNQKGLGVEKVIKRNRL